MDVQSDPPGFAELMDHATWIQDLAHRLVQDAATADDLVQETWMAALRAAPTARTALRPWLTRVLQNFAKQRYRSEASRQTREQRVSRAEAWPSPAELVERAELHGQLAREVLALAEPYRSTLLLSYYEGLSSAEIARRRGVPEATVRAQVRRGRERLKTRLDELHGGASAPWCLALMPLVGDPGRALATPSALTVLQGGLAMKILVPAVCSFAVLLVLGRQLDWGSRATRPGDAPAALVDTSARSAPARAGMSDPAAVSGRVSMGGPFGRIVDEQGEPVPGFVVRGFDTQRDMVVEYGKSGADGRFALLQPAPAVDVQASIGWRLSASRLAWTDGVELLFHARRVPMAPLLGRVIDKASGQGVGLLQVRIGDGAAGCKRGSVVMTDAEGAFETERSYEPEVLTVELVGPGAGALGAARVFEHEHTSASFGQRATFMVNVGPTYYIELDGPPHVTADQLFAKIVQPGGEDITVRPVMGPMRASVHAGEPAWVRFDSSMFHNLGLGPWALQVATRDGYWFGTTPIETIEGADRTVRRIELAARGVLHGVLRDHAGEPLAGASMTLATLDHGRPFNRAITDSAGVFEWVALEPGSYNVRALHGGHQEKTVTVAIQAESVAQLELQLDAGTGARISGRAYSVSGDYASATEVHIHSRSRPDQVLATTIDWRVIDGVTVGEFLFEAVQPIEGADDIYDLFVAPSDFRTWTPQPSQVRPGDTVELTVDDSEALCNVGFRVFDAGTKRAIERFNVLPGVKGVHRNRTFSEVAFEELVLHDVPVASEIEYRIQVDGYAAGYGSAALEADEPDEPDENGRRYVEVHLAAGWSAAVALYAADPITSPQPSFSGARVSFDGVEYGLVGDDGRLEVSLPARPSQLAIDHPGWQIQADANVAADGRFDDNWWQDLRISMKPSGD